MSAYRRIGVRPRSGAVDKGRAPARPAWRSPKKTVWRVGVVGGSAYGRLAAWDALLRVRRGVVQKAFVSARWHVAAWNGT